MKTPKFFGNWFYFVALPKNFKDTDVGEVGAEEMCWHSSIRTLRSKIVRNDMPHYSLCEVVIELFIEVLDHVA